MNNIDPISYEELSELYIRTQRDLSVLYEVSNSMRTTLELNHILYIILTGVTSHMGLGFNRAVLFLVNSTARLLEPKMAIGPESGEHAQEIWQNLVNEKQKLDDLIKTEKVYLNIQQSSLLRSLRGLIIPLGGEVEKSLLNEAYHSGQALHIMDHQIQEYKEDILLKYFKTNELVIIPLKAKDKVNGLIVADNLYTKKPITDDDLRIFTMLANQAGLAIENSQLYEMAMHRSHTDSLTKLWNHGFFHNRLLHEIRTHQELSQNLSLLIIDIDNFKLLNDTLGHQIGDSIIKEMAQILTASCREIDSICRYGGEEFAIILPSTNKEQGFLTAERIRRTIESYQFADMAQNEKSKVTVSIGLAAFPEDSNNNDNLIRQADKAMYKAKFSGKNQTYISD